MRYAHSYDFMELPSERGPKGEQTPAAKTLHKLARKAVHFGPQGANSRSDSGKYQRRKLLDKVDAGEPVELCFETRPGAFIQRESREVRKVLQSLTSCDAAQIAPGMDPLYLHDYRTHPESGKRWRFGRGTDYLAADADRSILFVDAPKIFTSR